MLEKKRGGDSRRRNGRQESKKRGWVEEEGRGREGRTAKEGRKEERHEKTLAIIPLIPSRQSPNRLPLH